jgi:hypothetical protein
MFLKRSRLTTIDQTIDQLTKWGKPYPHPNSLKGASSPHGLSIICTDLK